MDFTVFLHYISYLSVEMKHMVVGRAWNSILGCLNQADDTKFTF